MQILWMFVSFSKFFETMQCFCFSAVLRFPNLDQEKFFNNCLNSLSVVRSHNQVNLYYSFQIQRTFLGQNSEIAGIPFVFFWVSKSMQC